MKNFITLILLCFACYAAQGQKFTYKIKADSVKITNDSCTAELILENSTKNVNGFLYNRGNGRTEFRLTTAHGIDDVLAVGQPLSANRKIAGGHLYNLTIDSANFIVKGVFGASQTIPTYTDAQMYFFPARAAFRAGLSKWWNDDSSFVGWYSAAFGARTKATNTSAFAIGTDASATGEHSFAGGWQATASGWISFSHGYLTLASNQMSQAFGYGSTASGYISTAFGSSYATGTYSSAFGAGTKSKSYTGTVIGFYNDSTNATSPTSFNAANRAFQIGNGTADNARANAMTVLFNGNVGIGPVSPTALVHIGASTTSRASLRLDDGTAPTSPNNGDVWHASNHLYARLNGATIQLDDASGPSWSLTGNAGTSSSTNFLGTTDNNPLLVKTNNTERMRIFGGGNVAIGTTTDDGQTFQVAGQMKLSYSTNSPALEFSADNNGYSHFLLKNVNTGTSAGVGLRYQNDSAILSQIFLSSKSSVFGSNTFFIDQLAGNIALAARTGYIDIRTGSDITSAGSKMRLLANGNVGINTTSPTTKLHVAGTGLFTDTLTATTMATSDSSNRVATTAYVKRQTPVTDSTLKFQGGMLGVKVDTVLSYFTRDYRSNYAEIHEEFWNGVNEMGTDWSGTSSSVAGTATTEANHPGLVQLATGTQSNGRASVMSYFSPVYMGSGQCYYETQVNIPTLSTSTQRFQLVCGLFASYTGVTQASGVFFLYDEGGVSTGSTAASYWQTCTGNGGTRTYNTSLTQTTVAAGWAKLRIYLDYVSGQASFYINGTLVSTHTANLPSSTDMNFGVALFKSAGTTSRTTKIDYVSLQRHFATAR